MGALALPKSYSFADMPATALSSKKNYQPDGDAAEAGSDMSELLLGKYHYVISKLPLLSSAN